MSTREESLDDLGEHLCREDAEYASPEQKRAWGEGLQRIIDLEMQELSKKQSNYHEGLKSSILLHSAHIIFLRELLKSVERLGNFEDDDDDDIWDRELS